MNTQSKNKNEIKSRFLMSKRTQRWSRVAYAVGSKLSGHPFAWNTDSNLAEGIRKKMVVWKLFCCAGALQLVYVIGRLVFVLLDETTPLFQSFYMRIMTMIYSFGGIFLLGVILHRHELHQFHNQYIKFGESFEELYKSRVGRASSHKYALLGGFIIQGAVLSLGGIGLALVLKAFLLSGSLDCLSSMLPVHLSNLLATRIALTAFMLAVLNCYLNSILIVVVTSLPFVIQTIVILEELGEKTHRWTSDRLRQRGNVSKIWNCLQLQMSSFNEIYSGEVILFIQVIIVMVLSTVVYLSLTTTGLARLFFIGLGVTAVVLVPLCFVFCAHMHSLSSKLLKGWKYTDIPRTGASDQQERAIFSRALASYRPLKISFHGLYYLDKPLLLTMVDLVICETVALLILVD